jgi:hypothetical protein
LSVGGHGGKGWNELDSEIFREFLIYFETFDFRPISNETKDRPFVDVRCCVTNKLRWEI